VRLGYYLALLGMRVRTSLSTGMQYRWDFLIDLAMSLFWAGVSLMPLWVLKGVRAGVEGWTYPEMVIVTSWFLLLKGLIDAAVNPSLMAVVERIRDGTLDFVLLKPADAQFLVSTEKFEVLRLSDVAAGLLLLGYGFHLLGRGPAIVHVALALALLVAAAMVLYSVWLLVVCVAFWVVRLDNLAYLFMSVFDFARWPVSIFRGALRFVFTFVIPLAIMTTYPSLALLGKLDLQVGAAAFGGAFAFALFARAIWKQAIGHYTSASS
jgi:ABC-2 type transport system permease protein